MAHEVKNEGHSLIQAGQNQSDKFPQFLAAFLATLSAVAAGSSIAWTSPTLPLLIQDGKITKDEGPWVGSLLTLGAFVGALPAGTIANKIGRKTLLLSVSVPLIAAWGLIILVSNVWGLYVGRALTGVCVGVVSVAAPMYLSEIAENSIRGTLGTFFQLQLTVGVFVAYIVGLVKDAFFISVILSTLPIVFACTFVCMPESPIYLMSKQRKEDAQNSLQWLRGKNCAIDAELTEMRISANRSAAEDKASIADLFSSRITLKALCITLGLMVFQQMSGINAVIFYSQNIFQSVGSALDPTVATIIVGAVQVLATYTSSLLIERAGRRFLLILSDSVMTLCLLVLGGYFYMTAHHFDVSHVRFLPLVVVTLFIIVFSLGFGPIPWVLMGELFPSKLKGASSGLAASFSWLLGFVVTKTFTDMNSPFTYWFFGVVSLVGTIFVTLCVPETKGKDTQTILDELAGHRPSASNRNGGEEAANMMN